MLRRGLQPDPKRRYATLSALLTALDAASLAPHVIWTRRRTLPVAAGAVLLNEVQDEPDGDRRGRLRDPFGHEWMVATRKEVLSTEEMRKRFAPAGYKVE